MNFYKNKYYLSSKLPGEILERRSIIKLMSAISITMLFLMLFSGSLYYSLYQVIRFAGFNFDNGPAAEIVEQICYLLAYIVTYLFPTFTLYFILGYKYRFSKMFKIPNKTILAFSLPITLSAGVLFTFLIGFIESITNYFGFYALEQQAAQPASTAAFILFLLARTIVPAFLEELFFRGIMLHGLRRHGDTFAILLSSLMFAISHNNIFNCLYAFVLGMIISYFVIRTGSLLTGIVIHFTNNSLSVLLSYFETLSEGQIIITFIYLIIIVMGLISIIILVNKDPNIFIIHDRKIHLNNSYKMKYACGNIFFIMVIIAFFINTISSVTVT